MAGDWGIFAGLISFLLWVLSITIVNYGAEFFNITPPQYTIFGLLFVSIMFGFYFGLKINTVIHKQTKPWLFDYQSFEE